MFSFNPLLSKSSQVDIILSSDIPLSKEELIKIKNKIAQEKIVAPQWIYIDDKMYLVEKKPLETSSEKENKEETRGINRNSKD